MCPKPSQSDEIDLVLMEINISELMEDTPNFDNGLPGGELRNQSEDASRSRYRDTYLKMRVSNKSSDNQ